MSAMPREYDVAIVGGAFSGSATAILLLKADPSLRVLIIEKNEAFDRKVGESSIELSTWFITKMLRLHRHLAIEQLPKHGQRFWYQNEKVQSLADASELGNFYQARVGSHHIDRAVLDEHVAAAAVKAGAVVMRPARMVEADLVEGGRSTLQVEDANGRTSVSARWVVDATGRKAWLARRMGLISAMPEHPTRAVWARYRGVRDFDSGWLAGPVEGSDAVTCARGLSTNHFTGLGYWIWYIPLPGGDVSVGVVWDDRLMDLPPGEKIGDRFEAFLRSLPAGREMMEKAERLEGDLHQLNALPYRVSQLMGDGWTMVGDASGFIDPFYSPGLDWASLTITKCTEVIARSLRGEDCASQIARHNAEFTMGFDRWFKAVYQDKYYYMGDHELMEIALRMEVSMYYLGMLTPPYRMGRRGMQLPFLPPGGTPFYAMMRFVNKRLASLARARLAAGTWGRRNAGCHVLLSGFKLGAGNLKWVPGALARLVALEVGAIPGRIAARRGIAPPESAPDVSRG
jgi:flavin-dependent dehydrogenase